MIAAKGRCPGEAAREGAHESRLEEGKERRRQDGRNDRK
jgi:hypothetical protein